MGAAREPSSPIMTGHLGFDLADDSAGRYKVGHIYEGGPPSADWIKVSRGDYLIALNGRPVKAGDDYNEWLNRRLNRKVALTLNSKPTPDGAWTIKIDPISSGAFAELRYKKWIDDWRGRWWTSSPAAGSGISTSRRWTSPRWRSSRRS